MGGGLMQLVAYGAQDIYLTGNPQITFFKVVYRRHTNFSMETIEQTLNGSSTAVTDTTSTCTISRNGDLVYKVYVSDTTSTATTNGSVLVKEVELEIGGQRIDKHTSEWMNVWTELSTPESKAIGLKAMQCDTGIQASTGVTLVQIPLQFWFCRNPGLALPLIALQYHEVKLKFTWDGTAAGATSAAPQVWCDYIYLDTDERRRFAQVSHEYLIEQLQEQTYEALAGDKKLNFNHPVKELIWVPTNIVSDGTTYQLKLNGHDRFSAQEKEYFTLRQPFDYHTAIPRQNLPGLSRPVNITASSDRLILAPTAGTAFTNPAGSQVQVGFTDTAVTYNGTIGGTCAVFDKDTSGHNAATALKIFYTFLESDFSSVPAVGDTLMISYGGAQSDTETANADATKIVKVVAVEREDNTNINAISGVTWAGSSDLALVFDQTLINIATYSDNDAVAWSIFSITRLDDSSARTSKMTKNICVYSFALKPEEHQPSGTCNFSRIDNAQLNVGVNSDGGGTLYAVNYNVLRIMSGMGGLAYSN
jgi:hypothetical protein